METRTRAGVMTLGNLSLIVLSTLAPALAAPETDGGTNRVTYMGGEEAGPDAKDGSQYRADARYSGYTASQLPSDRSPVWKWEGKASSGPIVTHTSRTCVVGEWL